MLKRMQHSADASTSGSAASFAALLAALTPPPVTQAPRGAEDSLADDIATLSYEQALRTHARYRPSHAPAGPQITRIGSQRESDKKHASAREDRAAAVAGQGSQGRRSASITLRMSAPESAQLRARAAEAGLTVSAYLRSCAFEVEALRAEVKQALAQLRPTVPAAEQTAERPAPPSQGWRARLALRWRGGQRAADA